MRVSAGNSSPPIRRSGWFRPTARGFGEVLGEAKEKADLGESFGPDLTAAEVRYLMAKEWARFPDDILWRRSKLGLTMGAGRPRTSGGFHGRGVKGRISSRHPQRCG